MCFKVKQTTTAKETQSLAGRSQPLFRSNVASNINSDLKIGVGMFSFGNRAKQNEKMRKAGYSQAAIDDYNKRTDASIARNKEAQEAARLRSEENNRDNTERAARGMASASSGSARSGGGIPSTVSGIINQSSDKALSYQEQLAQNELARARQTRTREKEEALRARLEGKSRGSSLLRRSGGRGYA